MNYYSGDFESKCDLKFENKWFLWHPRKTLTDTVKVSWINSGKMRWVFSSFCTKKLIIQILLIIQRKNRKIKCKNVSIINHFINHVAVTQQVSSFSVVFQSIFSRTCSLRWFERKKWKRFRFHFFVFFSFIFQIFFFFYLFSFIFQIFFLFFSFYFLIFFMIFFFIFVFFLYFFFSFFFIFMSTVIGRIQRKLFFQVFLQFHFLFMIQSTLFLKLSRIFTTIWAKFPNILSPLEKNFRLRRWKK